MRRRFRQFHLKDSNFRICSERFEAATAALRGLRRDLEAYLERHPEFFRSLVPVGVLAGAPESACRMAAAAARVGVGPMAAVAGTFAQMAAAAAMRRGASEAIVENGGDLYVRSPAAVTVGLYAGAASPLRGLAFLLPPERLPLALCSSSGRLGHSYSRGTCDLATVIASDAALADAAATCAGNAVRGSGDLEATVEATLRIRGVQAVLLVKDDRVAMGGALPELVRVRQADIAAAVTRDPHSPGG